MVQRKTFYLLGMVCILLAAACTKGISKQARSRVTYSGTFSTLQEKPDDHLDEVVLLGGKTIETKVGSKYSEITVLQLPLDGGDRPRIEAQSEGRFLIRSEQLLDPAVYAEGTAITVVGKVIGSEARKVGEYNYVYPVLEPIEIKLWHKDKGGGPGVHFGIGVFKTF
jgi:outer membrane lipoprotein